MHPKSTSTGGGPQGPGGLLTAVARVLSVPEVWKQFNDAGIGALAHMLVGARWVEAERLDEGRVVVRLVSGEKVRARLLESEQGITGGVN